MISCKVAGLCSGCPWIQKSYAEQLLEKEKTFRVAWREAGLSENALQDFSIREVGTSQLRNRVDLILKVENGVPALGLYDLSRNHRLSALMNAHS